MKLFIKFCGFQSDQEVLEVRKLPVTHVGFIFVPSSRRYIEYGTAKRCVPLLSHDQSAVLVIQNKTVHEIGIILSDIPFSVVQLHGKESPIFCKQLKEKKNILVWKALPYTEIHRWKDYAPYVDAILLDHTKAGSGKTFDWSIVETVYEQMREAHCLLIIAGGINATNVRTLLHHPLDGIDVASGIETNEKKDEQKMKEFIEVIQHG
ncbi:phosphoribosylanthranilate isomerase [Massilibacterium senegalense]|uniref:phosphoribosylanthranilate isomerase n=1 Tax=Massilibacterium senegalense TaxID=1632858 RepID=UPI0007823072|nr:phosphoribosylanthranilate isomerase [Massilibacterium senegalense]